MFRLLSLIVLIVVFFSLTFSSAANAQREPINLTVTLESGSYPGECQVYVEGLKGHRMVRVDVFGQGSPHWMVEIVDSATGATVAKQENEDSMVFMEFSYEFVLSDVVRFTFLEAATIAFDNFSVVVSCDDEGFYVVAVSGFFTKFEGKYEVRAMLLEKTEQESIEGDGLAITYTDKPRSFVEGVLWPLNKELTLLPPDDWSVALINISRGMAFSHDNFQSNPDSIEEGFIVTNNSLVVTAILQ